MKTLVVLLSLLICMPALAQDTATVRATDRIVAGIRREAKEAEHFRWLMSHFQVYRIDTALTLIRHRSKSAPGDLIENYYLKDGALVYYTREALKPYLYGKDTALLGCYYFGGGRLKHRVVYEVGPQPGLAEVEKGILARYYSALARFQAYQERSQSSKVKSQKR
ncbi:hypothetical protein [Flaviaesturariibacter amylovorans]|uniref:DUF4468 domain-containing protein n=1 Tax=Flaviaesturariibacter amylovorans TaxID=1084520 RepID=A0ABP8HVH6_9BACT